MPNFRSPKLLALASQCPICRSCGRTSETIVAAHSNAQRHGKGMGLKAHDCPAFVCNDCHSLIDGRTGHMDRTERESMFMDAMFNTFLWLLQEGHLKVT